MKGTLAKVQFELKHFAINNQNEDSFCTLIQQVLVLKPGQTHPITAYKRKVVEEGPVALLPRLCEGLNEDDGSECEFRSSSCKEQSKEVPREHTLDEVTHRGAFNYALQM